MTVAPVNVGNVYLVLIIKCLVPVSVKTFRNSCDEIAENTFKVFMDAGIPEKSVHPRSARSDRIRSMP